MKTIANIIAGLNFSQPSLPAIHGDLSEPKDERMDEASAALESQPAAGGIWDYASHRTLDFSEVSSSPTLRRLHAWHFGARSEL